MIRPHTIVRAAMRTCPACRKRAMARVANHPNLSFDVLLEAADIAAEMLCDEDRDRVIEEIRGMIRNLPL